MKLDLLMFTSLSLLTCANVLGGSPWLATGAALVAGMYMSDIIGALIRKGA